MNEYLLNNFKALCEGAVSIDSKILSELSDNKTILLEQFIIIADCCLYDSLLAMKEDAIPYFQRLGAFNVYTADHTIGYENLLVYFLSERDKFTYSIVPQQSQPCRLSKFFNWAKLLYESKSNWEDVLELLNLVTYHMHSMFVPLSATKAVAKLNDILMNELKIVLENGDISKRKFIYDELFFIVSSLYLNFGKHIRYYYLDSYASRYAINQFNTGKSCNCDCCNQSKKFNSLVISGTNPFTKSKLIVYFLRLENYTTMVNALIKLVTFGHTTYTDNNNYELLCFINQTLIVLTKIFPKASSVDEVYKNTIDVLMNNDQMHIIERCLQYDHYLILLELVYAHSYNKLIKDKLDIKLIRYLHSFYMELLKFIDEKQMYSDKSLVFKNGLILVGMQFTKYCRDTIFKKLNIDSIQIINEEKGVQERVIISLLQEILSNTSIDKVYNNLNNKLCICMCLIATYIGVIDYLDLDDRVKPAYYLNTEISEQLAEQIYKIDELNKHKETNCSKFNNILNISKKLVMLARNEIYVIT